MTRTLLSVAVAALLAAAAPAAAQTLGAPLAPANTGTGTLSLGVMAGAGAVQNLGGLVGGELGYQVNDQVEVLGEVVWLQNVVTRRRLDVATQIATFLQTSQGSTATSTINAPALFFGGAVRYMLSKSGSVRPFVTFGAGLARVTYNPKFTLGGANVTPTLSTYGVTLGSDLDGTVTKPAFTGGAGIRMVQGKWYFLASVQLTSIQTDQQAARAIEVGAGLGMSF
jgi:hypothetical protein